MALARVATSGSWDGDGRQEVEVAEVWRRRPSRKRWQGVRHISGVLVGFLGVLLGYKWITYEMETVLEFQAANE